MSDYYPPGVRRLPDDKTYTCDNCGVVSDHEGYDECPKCGDQNLCNSCLHCHSCDTDFRPCECGSGILVVDFENCCLCEDDEDELLLYV